MIEKYFSTNRNTVSEILREVFNHNNPDQVLQELLP